MDQTTKTIKKEKKINELESNPIKIYNTGISISKLTKYENSNVIDTM